MAKSKIAIIGLGRIGGSLGLAIKNAKVDADIVGHDKNPSAASRAQKRGAVDKTDWNLMGACDGAGLIILALPLDGIKDTLAVLKQYIQPGVIITDTAATKAPVLEWAKDLPAGVQFIGGHPVLKSDRPAAHGIDSADAQLFNGATYCLTPSVNADANTIDTMTNFARMIGATPYFLDAAEHDGLAAGVEHLPALLATALASITMSSQGWRELGRLASTNFRAATDLAPQSEDAATEQFMAHRADLIRWLETTLFELQKMRGILASEDSAALKAMVKTMLAKRDEWLSGKLQDTGEPSIDTKGVGGTLGHLFLGGLADRGMPKPRK